jgi:hypothetical protein
MPAWAACLTTAIPRGGIAARLVSLSADSAPAGINNYDSFAERFLRFLFFVLQAD